MVDTGSEFYSQNPCKKAGHGAPTCNLSHGEIRDSPAYRDRLCFKPATKKGDGA